MSQQHLLNVRAKEKERDITLNLFDSYTPIKPKTAPNCVESEQRDLISKLIGKSFKITAGLTRGWTAQEMFELRKKAESFKANPAGLMWKLIREHNSKIKQQLCKNQNTK